MSSNSDKYTHIIVFFVQQAHTSENKPEKHCQRESAFCPFVDILFLPDQNVGNHNDRKDDAGDKKNDCDNRVLDFL